VIRRASPVRFDRLAESGRNRPLRVTLETADGQEHEAFVKVSAGELGIEGLANEALAACLAGDLGLPINDPFLVELDPAWVSSIRDSSVLRMVQNSAPVAFGCRAAGSQWKLWSASDILTPDRRPMALAILAFDAYIENDDRRPTNSNCLVKGGEFRIIDHELAFRIQLKLFPRPEPWRQGYLERLVGQDGHAFGAKLKGQQGLDFAPLKAAWMALPDKRLAAYLSALPAEWSAANEAMKAALAHIRVVRDRIEDCIAELQRVLK
jgi:HipA-like kinase